MKGDAIVFLQNVGDVKEPIVTSESSKSWIDTMMNSVSWVSSGGNFQVSLVGPEGEQDNLWEWLNGKNVIVARTAVLYNHSVVRHFLDHHVLGNVDEPSFKPDASTLPVLESSIQAMRLQMRREAGALTDDLSKAVEMQSQIDADDVAAVRDSDNGGALNYVCVNSSQDETTLNREAYFEKIKKATVSSESGNATINRSKDPVSEFHQNGVNIMHVWRHVFPLMIVDYKEHRGKVDEESGAKVSRPLKAHGTVSVDEATHMFLQHTAVLAQELPLVFYVANQRQRHSVILSSSLNVCSGNERKFHEIVGAPDFAARLQDAIVDPTTKDANKLYRDCIRIFTTAGSSKPWSASQRQALLPQMLAMADRHGNGSIFYTIAQDDTHNSFVVRLAFPSKSNHNFPSFATTEARNYWQTSDGDVHVSEREGVSSMMAALRDRGYIDLPIGNTGELTPIRLQRLATENPIAAAHVFEHVVLTVKKVLFGSDIASKKTHPSFVCAKGGTAPTCIAPHTTTGIFGLVLADTSVTEQNERKALHTHGLLFTALSPALLAKAAGDSKLWGNIANALDSQLVAQVPVAAHVIVSLHKSMGIPLPRASFTSATSMPPSLESRTMEQKQHDSAINVLTLNGHFTHSFTCHKNKAGEFGCRSGYPKPHWIEETHIVQLVCTNDVLPKKKLAGNRGTPWGCSGRRPSCIRSWDDTVEITSKKSKRKKDYAEDDDEEAESELSILVQLVKPQPAPPKYTKMMDDVKMDILSLFALDKRNLQLELQRPGQCVDKIENSNSMPDDADTLLKKLQKPQMESDRADSDPYVLELLDYILHLPDIQSTLERPLYNNLKTKLADVTPAEARTFLVGLRDSLPCANSRIVDFNTVLTDCLCCNTAPYSLGAGRQALAATFYVIKYMKKEAFKLSQALAVLLEARKHQIEFGRNDPTDSQHTGAEFSKSILRRAVIKADGEIGGTVAASIVLGHPASHTTEIFKFSDGWDAFREAQFETCNYPFPLVEETAGHFNTTVDAVDESQQQEDDLFILNLEDDEGSVAGADEMHLGSSNSRVYKVNGQAIEVSEAENYKFRGELLATMNFIVYNATMEIKLYSASSLSKNEDQVHNAAGRHPNKIFLFDKDHPLRNTHVQRVREKFVCLMRAGTGRPRFPQPLPTPVVAPSAAWLRQEQKAAGYYASLFIPWSVYERPKLTVSELNSWMRDVQTTATADEHSSVTWEERLRAAGVMQEITNYAFHNQLSKQDNSASKKYRNRNQDLWTEEEKREYETSRGGTNDTDIEERTAKALEALLEAQNARKFSERRLKTAVDNETFLKSLADSHDSASRGLLKLRKNFTFQNPNLLGTHRLRWDSSARADRVALQKTASLILESYSSSQVQDIAELLSAEKATTIAALPTTKQRPSIQVHSSKTTRRQPNDIPFILRHVSQREFAAEQKIWIETFQDAFQHGISSTPDPPLNPEQRAVGRRMLVEIRRVNLNKTQECNTAPEIAKFTGIMVLGAAGTGKSFMQKAVLSIMKAENLGTAVFTAYMGIATTQVPKPSATLCWLMSLNSNKIPQNGAPWPPLTPKQVERFESIAGKASDLSLFVVDELSCLDTSYISGINERLQQLRNNTLPFGGLVFVLYGDFEQKPPVGGLPLSKALVLSSGITEDILKSLDICKQLGAGKKKFFKLDLNSHDDKGARLAKGFELHTLTQQMRASEDPQRTAFLEQLRDPNAEFPITVDIIESLQVLSTNNIKTVGPKLLFAPRAALSHDEVNLLNYSQARAFALHHKVPLYWWEKELVGQSATWLTADETKEVYVHERTSLCGFFVNGAPGITTRNINTASEIVNGGSVIMHSLTLPPDSEPLSAYVQQAEEQRMCDGLLWDGILEVQIPQPQSINVRPLITEATASELLKQKCSLSQSEVVLPILLGHSTEDVSLCSVWAAEHSIPNKLRVKEHEVQLNFCCTDFKVQGTTLTNLVVSLGERQKPPYLTASAFYVLFSRVKTSANFYVIGIDPKDSNTYQHLLKIKRPTVLSTFYKGFAADRYWNDTYACAAASAAQENTQSASAAAKKAKSDQRGKKKRKGHRKKPPRKNVPRKKFKGRSTSKRPGQ